MQASILGQGETIRLGQQKNHLNLTWFVLALSNLACRQASSTEQPLDWANKKIVQILTQLLWALRDPDEKLLDLAKKSFKFRNELFECWLTWMDMQTRLESSTDSSKFEYVHFFTLRVYRLISCSLMSRITWYEFKLILSNNNDDQSLNMAEYVFFTFQDYCGFLWSLMSSVN